MHPKLFNITCNINIQKFNELLEDHPNQPYICSVIVGQMEGFFGPGWSLKMVIPSFTMNLNISQGMIVKAILCCLSVTKKSR